MDFPVYHLDFFGNRLLIAIIAITHVIMSHTMAVGGLPLVTFLEWKGYKSKDQRWDKLAFKILFIFFLFTTSLGAMTGVGIWFSASLVNPSAIGSLIRVFFWAWFAEWGAFITEVVLILAYYLTWKKWVKGKKLAHVKLGAILGFASFITMMIIVAILAYMMDIGAWRGTNSFWDAAFNPVYLPQLAFRACWGMLLAGAAAQAILAFSYKDNMEFFLLAKKTIAKWILFWLPFVILSSIWYWSVVPDMMKLNVPAALTTQAFQHWYGGVLKYTLMGMTFIIIVSVMIVNKETIRYIKRPVMVLPYIIGLTLIGQFERVREFIRKPYVIADYLYANTVRVDDLPLLTNEGMLKYSNFARVREITKDNKIEAGREVFKIACTRCHTVSPSGINSIHDRLYSMYQDQPRDEEFKESIKYYILNIHLARPYMPPFPGNEEEAQALAEYLAYIHKNNEELHGDQVLGSKVKRN